MGRVCILLAVVIHSDMRGLIDSPERKAPDRALWCPAHAGSTPAPTHPPPRGSTQLLSADAFLVLTVSV